MIQEQKTKTVVLSFGRMNPITIGHGKLVDKIKSVAKSEGATPQLYLSHSQDKAKNPLTYDEKYQYARQAFGSLVQKSNSKTIINVLKELDGKFDRVIMIVGSDRTKEFDTLLNKYNGKEYTFDSIDIVSAGERDPDAEGVSGMSASKMRALAAENDYSSFVKGLPRNLQPKKISQKIFDTIRERMGITEDMTPEEGLALFEVLTLQQRRKRKLTMRRIKNKIKRGRRIAQRKMAGTEKLQARARRRAKEAVRKRVAGQRGENYKQLSPSQKIQIDKMVEKRKGLIDKLAKRLMPQVRKAERERLKTFRQRKREGANESNIIAELSPLIESIERIKLANNIQQNLEKKSQRYGVPIEELKHAYVSYSQINETEQKTFQSLNSMLANRSKAVMEAIEYHSDNDIPLYENVFRMYSDNYFQFFREARNLYSKGMLSLDAAEEEIINTDIGEFGIYEENGRRERVPLDCPMINEIELSTDVKKKSYSKLKTHNASAMDSYFKEVTKNRIIKQKKFSFDRNFDIVLAKGNFSPKDITVYLIDTKNDNRVAVMLDLINYKRHSYETYEVKTRSTYQGKGLGYKLYTALIKDFDLMLVSSEIQSLGGAKLWAKLFKTRGISVYGYNPKSKKDKFFDVDIDNSGKVETLYGKDLYSDSGDWGNLNYSRLMAVSDRKKVSSLKEEDEKDVELNQPKRGGSKKFYVYVKNPKTGNIMKVEFGDTGGLKVKLDDKEAARSFAARHQCSQKKDKTKPGYWACRLPRYAKQLGLSGGGSHFW